MVAWHVTQSVLCKNYLHLLPEHFHHSQLQLHLAVKQFLSFSAFSQQLANSNLFSASELTCPGYFMLTGSSTTGRFIAASFHLAIRDCRMAGNPQYVTREGN